MNLSPREAQAGCERTVHLQAGTSLIALLIRIPAGIEDGQTLRLVMEEQPGVEVFFQVRVR